MWSVFPLPIIAQNEYCYKNQSSNDMKKDIVITFLAVIIEYSRIIHHSRIINMTKQHDVTDHVSFVCTGR